MNLTELQHEMAKRVVILVSFALKGRGPEMRPLSFSWLTHRLYRGVLTCSQGDSWEPVDQSQIPVVRDGSSAGYSWGCGWGWIVRPKKSQRLSGKGELISDTKCAERTDHGFHQCGLGVDLDRTVWGQSRRNQLQLREAESRREIQHNV